MSEPRDFYDRHIVYSRAEPDDEYDNPKSEPLDPFVTEDDEDELDEDEI